MKANDPVKMFFAFLIMLYTGTLPVWCDEEDTGKENRTFFAFPTFSYTTDTGFGAGAAAIKGYHRDRVRLSTIRTSFYYTVKKQFFSSFLLNHYLPGNRDMVSLQVYYSKFPTNFYGLGNNTSNSDPERFTPEYFRIKSYLEHTIKSYFMIRMGFFLHNQALVKSEPGGTLVSSGAAWYRGRLDAGPELSLVRDTRDNIIASHSGSLVQAVYWSSIMNDDGNDFNAMALEARKFFNPVSDVVFAFMALAKDTRGDVPFYLLPVLGGEDRLRGYELDRFTGRSMILFQQDIRFPVWGPFSGAVFAATGRVAPDVESLFSGTYHSSAGCGVRWYFNEEDNLVIRFDAAWGSDSNGVYIGFGEAF